MAFLCRMHGGAPIPAIPHTPSCSTSSPTASACPQMTSSPPVASPAPLYSAGAEPQRGSLGLAARAGSRLSAGRSPLFGRDVSGNSSGSPSALLRLSEWGPHCFCRPDLTHGAEAAAAPPWSDCKECAAVSLPGRPTSKVCLAAKEGCSGLRLALEDRAVASLVPELAPAGPTEAKWWTCAGCGRGILPGCTGPPAVPSGPLLDTSQAVPADLGGHVETHAHEVILRRGRRRGSTGPVCASDEEVIDQQGASGGWHTKE